MIPFPKIIERCLFVLLFYCCACSRGEERKLQRSFYYFKTVFSLSPKEQQSLSNLSVNNLYVKFFDVGWNESIRSPQPIARAIFQQPPPATIRITPLVFITLEPLQKSDTTDLQNLAININKLLSEMAANNRLQLSGEVQVDCDWTKSTKDHYFYLLNALKKQPFFQKKTLSATIRLHQLKFLSQNGIPPVEKGLLMCYNMGNLRNPQTKNSIIEKEELKKYTNNLSNYPLALDVALPIFDWWALFEREQYKGLLREFKAPENWKGKDRIYFTKDTVIEGYSFRAGQWLRHEESEAQVVQECAEHISKNLKAKELTVILYHLQQANLSKYDQNELESFFNSFR